MNRSVSFLCFTICFVLLSQTVCAQSIVRSIRFSGNHHFSERQLIDRLPLKPGSPFSANSLESSNKILYGIYASEGFYTFSIDSTVVSNDGDTASVDLAMFITEGRQTVVHSVSFSGNRSIPSDRLSALMETTAGKPLVETALQADILAIVRLYSNSGFPFASIITDSTAIDPENESNLMIRLLIHEGSLVFVDEIGVEGNETTAEKVIVREARLTVGELFSDEKIERIRRRIERLQLFKTVSLPQLYVKQSDSPDTLRGGLTIRVSEGSANSFDGIIGYVPANVPGESGFFTGDVFVAFRNLFGTGRKAMVKWKRESELTQELELQYLEPWLFSYPLNLGGTFYQRKQDSSYVKSKFDLRLDFALTEDLTITGNISTESVYPAASVQVLSVFESRTLYFGGEIRFDSRDNIRNPANGIFYSTTAQQGTKKITGPPQFISMAKERNITIKRYTLDAEGYISPLTRHVMMTGIHGRQLSSSQLEVSDLFQFGGTNSIRGYRENQFYASTVVWMNIEYRYLIGTLSSLFGFVDGGYYARGAEPVKGIVAAENSLYGYGIGMRVETGLGIMHISYALGEGDGFSSGKIHAGIVNEF